MQEDLKDPEPKIKPEKPKIMQENSNFDRLLPTLWFTFAQPKPKPKLDKIGNGLIDKENLSIIRHKMKMILARM